MSDPLPRHEVFALKYAQHDRTRGQMLVWGDPHDAPMPIDFYVWLIRGGGRTVLVDTGFGEAEARRRGRALLRCPTEALRLIGVEPADVDDVVITHLHYDHAGNLERFPRARFHLQDEEMRYATGRSMGFEVVRRAYAVDDVVEMVKLVYGDRVCFHAGDAELAPGISLHHIGGHTRGLQSVRVHTARGFVVLASDAAHFYENLDNHDPFIIVESMTDMLAGHDRLLALADSRDHVVPGHDPLVMRLYPPPAPALEGIVARLDVAPRTA